MSQLSLKNIQLSFSGKELFRGLELKVEKGERICLLGRNGSGKSTLMKIILNEIKVDAGEILREQGLLCTALKQEVPQAQDKSIYDIVCLGLGKIGELIIDYNHIQKELEQDSSEKILDKLDRVQRKIDDNNHWELMKDIDSIISKMDLNPDDNFFVLSAGMKRRVMLAQALVSDPDILLLDEPTNHLDLESIKWLEDFLLRYSGTIVFVTHDRTFLQNIATRIVSVDRGELKSYDCDYKTYLERLKLDKEIEKKHNSDFDKILAQEEVWIRKGIKARRTRNEGRVRNLENLRLKRSDRIDNTGNVSMKIQEGEKSGRCVFKIKDLAFSFSDNSYLVNDFTARVDRGDKIALIGPNGVGKSTLIKLILGELEVTSGTVERGSNIRVSYFDQLHMQLDEDKTLLENISPSSDFIEIGSTKKHVMGYLQDFLFTPEKARGGVANLSGGEKNRLLLAKMFTKESNVLVLDEPTNDLDVETLELLEEKLLDYTGTLIMVSHDRTFVDNIATSTYVFEGDGVVKEYIGGYSDWLRQSKEMRAGVISNSKTAPIQSVPLNEEERKALHNLPIKIENLEKKEKLLQNKMAGTGFYDQSKDEIDRVMTELSEIENQIKLAYSQWESLEKKS